MSNRAPPPPGDGLHRKGNTMRALTIIQPWASLIVLGYKRVENRTWSTPYRGRLLIHAGKKSLDASGISLAQSLGIRLPDDLPCGAIVGECELVSCSERRDLSEEDPFWFGPVGWRLTNAICYPTPIPCRGSLGLWTPPAELLGAEFQSDGLPAAVPGRRSGRKRSDDQPRLF